jgi:hypothetical protein
MRDPSAELAHAFVTAIDKNEMDEPGKTKIDIDEVYLKV